jgi:hypothetical protein
VRPTSPAQVGLALSMRQLKYIAWWVRNKLNIIMKQRILKPVKIYMYELPSYLTVLAGKQARIMAIQA